MSLSKILSPLFSPEECSTMRALASAINAFLSERKALASQLDRCSARNSKMATKIIMVFREGLRV